jgi:hypothetical protein
MPLVVVLHFEDELGTIAGQAGVDRGGVGVAGDVGQHLLKDAEDRHRELRRQMLGLPGTRQPAVGLGPTLEVARLPLQRRDKPEVIEDPGPQLARDPPDGTNDAVDGGAMARAFFGTMRVVSGTSCFSRATSILSATSSCPSSS